MNPLPGRRQEGPPAPPETGLVVVGVSPTSGSASALALAAREADYRGCRLRAVSAWKSNVAPGRIPRPPAVLPLSVPEVERLAQQSLADSVIEALGRDREVELVVRRGETSRVLLQESREAELLVVGPPHPGVAAVAIERRHPGRLLYRAPCPVLVVTRASERRGRPEPSPAAQASRSRSGLSLA